MARSRKPAIIAAPLTIRDWVAGTWWVAGRHTFSPRYRRRGAWWRLVIRGAVHRNWHDSTRLDCIECERERVTVEAARQAELTRRGLCVRCEQPATLAQAGRCVYADPCGHRQWQGRIPAKDVPA